MTRVPKAYKENYPTEDEIYIDISNKDLRDLIIYNRQAIENWREEDIGKWREEFKELKDITSKLQNDYSETKFNVKSIKESIEWMSNEYVDIEKRVDQLEKNLDSCPICSDRINVEEFTKTITLLSEKFESLSEEIKEMKDNRREITTNTLVWITIIVTLVSSVVAAVLSKVL